MRFLDLLSMSCSNLWKRKVRTLLTVLGVVIGTASIVVMVSLGIGLSDATMRDIEKYAGLTNVTVTLPYNSENTNQKDIKYLDDSLVMELSRLEHVKYAYPQLDVSVLAKSGPYEANLDLTCIPTAAIQNINVQLEKGELPLDETELSFLYGNQAIINFYNSKTNSSYWNDGVVPDLDLENDTIFLIYDTDAYYNFGSGGSVRDYEDGNQPQAPPKKYMAKFCGLIAGGLEDYNNYSWGVIANLEATKTFLKRAFKGKAIPGQPTNKRGKPFKEIYYNRIIVDVEGVDFVADVQKTITEMGYQSDSSAEWVEQAKQQTSLIQTALGGIGAVSLVVAAIGIINTMMMSIYERTKEIGVMKVLGCDMNDIRSLFLMEAAFIGFLGGVAGVILSYILSYVINQVMMSMGNESGLSLIPVWLSGSAVGFAILIGMLAGLMPAQRAMHLSPLAAIRNE